MRKLILVSFSLLFLNFTLISIISARHADYDFMQDVGGIRIEDPIKHGNDYFLPVKCDVSGLTQFTTKPKGINSGLVIYDVKCKLIKNNIDIYVIYGLPDKRYSNASYADLTFIGKMKPGCYNCYYLNKNKNKHFLKTVEVK